MVRPIVVWEEGDEVLSSQGGLGIIGALVDQLPLGQRLNRTHIPENLKPDIAHRDIVVAYMGLLAQGKSDFDHIEAYRRDPFFGFSLGISQVPSSPTVRQRLGQAAARDQHPLVQWSAIIRESNVALLQKYARLVPVTIDGKPYIPLDCDVSPFDNGKTRKEGGSRTYKGTDGYAPMMGYLGHDGYALAFELREGKQHCQKGTPAFLVQCLRDAQAIITQRVDPAQHPRILVRLDSGNDSADNIDVIREEQADFLIKRNLRQQSLDAWLDRAKQEGAKSSPREGKSVYRGAFEESPRRGHAPERCVYQVIERTITADGQILLIPDIEVAAYWTSLTATPDDVLPWYPDHGTMEQYHSEVKTDMDLERLPSGKFATNQLVLHLACLTYNLLRVIGQATIGREDVPLRKAAQRRRIRTVIQNIILCAAKLVAHARQYRIRYGRGNRWGRVTGQLYAHFAAG